MLSLSSDFEWKTFALLLRKYGHNCQKCNLPLKKNDVSNFFWKKNTFKNSFRLSTKFAEFWQKSFGKFVETAFCLRRQTN